MDSLNDLKIQEVFNEEKADEYRKRFKLIWDELVSAHSSMLVLEHVRNFPHDLLFSPTKQPNFLKLVERNFDRQVGLIVSNVFEDKDERSATFNTLMEWIKKNCLPEPSDKVLACLDQINDSSTLTSLRRRAWKLRKKLIAHLDWKYALDPTKLAEIQITYDERQTLVSETGEVLQKLCVEGGVSLFPFDYSPLIKPAAGTDPRIDIEILLDLLASSDGSILLAPEENSYYWKNVHLISINREWSEEDKKTFNYWRRRIGKDEISFD